MRLLSDSLACGYNYARRLVQEGTSIGLRGAVDSPFEVNLPGRFTVIAGANGGGKTTFSDAVYLGHAKKFPRLPRHSAAALGAGDRDIELQYRGQGVGGRGGPQVRVNNSVQASCQGQPVQVPHQRVL